MEKINEMYTCATLPNSHCVVPIYQRLFVWEKVQINQLLEDLYESYKRNKDAPYYIGAITVVERENDEKQNYWEIVDGQQRLTFLTLFGAMSAHENKDWNIFLRIHERKWRMDYVGRYCDMNDLSSIAEKKTLEISNKNILWFTECYNAFMQSKEKIQIDNKEPFSKVEFTEFVRTKASFMRSLLSSNYSSHELNLYFERINATGRQLEPQELVKSLYFSQRASKFNKLIDFSTPYKVVKEDSNFNKFDFKILKDILEYDGDNPDLNKEPSQTRVVSSNRAIFSEATFLLHVLRLTCKKETKDDNSLNQYNLLTIFKNNFVEKKRDTYIEEMERYRLWLDDNIIYISDDGYAFREKNENTDNEDSKQKNKKLLQYQSMLAVSSSANQEWILNAYEKYKEKNLTLNDLKELDNKELPNVESMTYQSINRYWFWKLDYVLWEQMYEKLLEDTEIEIAGVKFVFYANEVNAIKNYKFKPNRSIEHLHPQTSVNPWKQESLHSFGNLAMISSSFNSAQSNDGIGMKFARLSDRINQGQGLESIKLLLMFKLAKSVETNWTENVAEKHGQDMHSLLKSKDCNLQ